MRDLIGWQIALIDAPVGKTWQPAPLAHADWPPDYTAVYEWRRKTLHVLALKPDMLDAAKAYYSTRPQEFIMHWFDTYDPRSEFLKWMPFVFFTKQFDFITFLHDLRRDQQSGLVEKSRDMGATWLACAYSVWSWLFIPSDAIGWGSRKEDLVDTLGNADSIFEKMRLLINRMPAIFLPEGFVPKKHATFMKLVNPENGSTITGESGDNIGRGGRKSMYFKDEAAHYERPEKIEAALGDNTNVQIDISSVNGTGNVFYNRRESGIDWQPGAVIEKGFVRVFVMDWRDHPAKTQAWYDERRAKYLREGMLHVFAQEVDRNYAAAVDNIIIQPEWIAAAVDAHFKIPCLLAQLSNIPNIWGAGLDVADGGKDRNSLSTRQWIIWRTCEEWGERDVGVTARRAIIGCRHNPGIVIQYDCIGVGSGVKSEYNRLTKDEQFANIPLMTPWNAGAGVLNPFDRIIPDDEKSAMNKDFYGNLKAQAWWDLGRRFFKTWNAITNGAVYHPDELISLDSTMPLLAQLKKELAQAVRANDGSLRTIVDKKPKDTKSPNLADGGVMMYFPVPDNNQVLVGTYG